MDPKDFHCAIQVKETVESSFNAINNVAGWWATNVTGSSQQVGDRFTVRFGKTYGSFLVKEIIPGREITWLVEDCYLPLFKNAKEWVGTKLLWDLSSSENGSIINFTHEGLTPQLECYPDCIKGWSFYVKESLCKLITEGKGLPGTGIFARIFNGDRKYEGILYFKNDPLPDYKDGHLFVDVKSTLGETVTEAYNAGEYRMETFDVSTLYGEYFMVIENKPVYENIDPLNDILNLIRNHMEHKDYTASITVNADAKTAEQAISKVPEWWTEGYTGSSEKPDDVFTVTFGETFVTFKVTEVTPGKRIVWKVTDCYLHWQNDKKEWNGTEVVWDIESNDNSTSITMTHVGLVPEVECYENCREGWDFYIYKSLFKLLTEHKGMADLKNKVAAQAG